MTEAYPASSTGGASYDDESGGAALVAADWLRLAAAPTFAIMALLTVVFASAQADILCSVAEHASPLTGMTPMYFLMGAFHLPPWLKLISSRRNGTHHA